MPHGGGDRTDPSTPYNQPLPESRSTTCSCTFFDRNSMYQSDNDFWNLPKGIQTPVRSPVPETPRGHSLEKGKGKEVSPPCMQRVVSPPQYEIAVPYPFAERPDGTPKYIVPPEEMTNFKRIMD